MKRWSRATSVWFELGVLFIPSIPALIWLWPNLPDENIRQIVQCAAYVYVFLGVVVIGRRRWSWDQLGVNSRGVWLSLSCGGVLILLRIIAYLGLNVPIEFLPFQFWPYVEKAVYYFFFVGFVEELLFRGLMHRALEDWRGPLFAVAGSSLAFALWHIGWAGPLMIGHFLIGLFFGLIRHRSGGILGLVIVHGLDDWLAFTTATPLDPDRILQAMAAKNYRAGYFLLGDILFFGTVIFLLFVYPRIRPHGKANG